MAKATFHLMQEKEKETCLDEGFLSFQNWGENPSSNH